MAGNLLPQTKHMATVDLTKVESEKKLDSSIRLPRDRYTSRCVKETLEVSKSSGNLMVIRDWEIAAPDSFMLGNTKVIIAGVARFKQYLTLVNKDDAAKTKANLARFKEESEKLQLDIDWANFDPENPPLKAQGVIADAIWESEEGVQRKDPLPGQREGEPIKDSTGNPVIRYNPRIAFGGILGLGTLSGNAPY